MSNELQPFQNEAVDYTVGFMFNESLDRVALIRKVGGWQNGKLNGIGGKRKVGESFKGAHVREFGEETGYRTVLDDWIEFGTIQSATSKIVFYVSYGDLRLIGNPEFDKTGEEVVIKDLDMLDPYSDEAVDNLAWLIPLARNRMKEPRLAMVNAFYCGPDEMERVSDLLLEARKPFGPGEAR